MGTYKFAIKMLKTDLRQTILYLITMIFTTVILFYAYNIMDSDKFLSPNSSTYQMLQILLLFLTFLSMFIAFFSNSYFISSKSKEFAISRLSGVCSFKLVGTLVLQNLTIGIVGSIIGLAIGIATMPIVSAIMYKVLGVNGTNYSFTPDSIGITILITLFIICPYVIGGDYSYLIRQGIKDLLDGQKKVNITPVKKNSIVEENGLVVKKKSGVPSTRSTLILYFVPITTILVNFRILYFMLFFLLFFSIIGIQRLLRFYFPEKILELKNGKYANDKIKLISLSNLHYSLKKAKFLIVTLAVSSVTLIYIIGSYKQYYQVMVMGMFVYIYAMISLGASILYKFIIEASYRRHIFKQLRLIGYTTNQIKKIIRDEVAMLYGIAIIIPLIHILFYLIKFVSFGILTIQLAGILLAIFIGVFIFMIPISYLVYKKLTL